MNKTAVALLVVALLACSDFTLVGPDGNTPTTLFVGVTTSHDDQLSYDLVASFYRGTDASGGLRTPVDSVLQVDAAAVLPTADPRSPGRFIYRWQASRPGTVATGDSLLVRIPVADGSPPAAFSFYIPLTVRGDPIDVALQPGDDLLLHVSQSPVDTAAFHPTHTSWTLDVGSACGEMSFPMLTVRGSDAYPSELRIPREWLVPGDEPFAACFRAFTSYEVRGAPYDVSASVTTRLTWRIKASP